MSNAFRIHRKRPDLIAHDIKTSYEVEGPDGDAALITETIVVQLRRPTTPQAISLTATVGEIARKIDPRKDSFDPGSYARCAISLLEFVHSVDGLLDEDDQLVSWEGMTQAEREDLMCALPVDAVLDMANSLISAGRLDIGKKKPSTPTSPTSTPSASADAPSVPEE